MLTKSFFNFIGVLQESLLALGIGILIFVPITLAYFSEYVPNGAYSFLFNVSLVSVFLVMIIRPLADLLPKVSWVRPLVILRKGFGVLSASIVVAVMFSRFLIDDLSYLSNFFSFEHWSVIDGSILAPLGDLSALILLVTSNKFSKRVLGKNWKRIQKLSYVYFYAGASYEYFFLNQNLALIAMVVVTALVVAAFIKNRTAQTVTAPV